MAYSDRVGPGVLIVHDEFGLSRSLIARADEFREAGFTVLCPDIHGSDEPRAASRLRAGATHLTDNWHPRLGVVGYSIGADLGMGLAGEVDFGALVMFCGPRDRPWPDPSIPVQVHVGDGDPGVDVDALRRSIDALEDAELHIYQGAGVGFTNRQGAAYVEDAARLATDRTIDFLRYHLS
jgi:dienelactone hydrolase